MTDLDRLHEALKDMKIERDVKMCKLTTFHIGGPASIVVAPRTSAELMCAINAANRFHIPYYVIGNGSNLLVSDEGYKGLIVQVGQSCASVRFEGTRVIAGAGALLSAVARASVAEGMMGLEWAAGIPGTIGGAIAMNAGAYGGEIKQRLCALTVVRGGALQRVVPTDGDMGYRRSVFAAPACIVWEAELLLQQDDGLAKERMEEYMARRKSKQPLSYPSAGSTFKRPPGHYAGALIQQAGLKGFRVGDAQVSELHAGFVINRGNATFEDVIRLIETVQKKVFENSGVMLETEVKIIRP